MKDEYGFDLNYTEVSADEVRSKWYPIISGDSNKDGDYLIRLMVYKLDWMIKEFELADEPIEENIAKMIKAYELGRKILTYNYGKHADEYFKDNYSINWFKEMGSKYHKWIEISQRAVVNRQNDTEEFFKIIGENIHSWWSI